VLYGHSAGTGLFHVVNPITGTLSAGPTYAGDVVRLSDVAPAFFRAAAQGETATGAGFPWSATEGAPNTWFMYTPWNTTSGHRGITASASGGNLAGARLVAGQHHPAGQITGTRSGGQNSTTITITLNSSFNFNGEADAVKINPMGCTTGQPYVSPGQFTRKDAVINGKTAIITGLANTACYGIHVDVVHAQ
jgi:hypothetical protein